MAFYGTCGAIYGAALSSSIYLIIQNSALPEVIQSAAVIGTYAAPLVSGVYSGYRRGFEKYYYSDPSELEAFQAEKDNTHPHGIFELQKL